MAKVISSHMAGKTHFSLHEVSNNKDFHICTTVGTTANSIMLARTFLQLTYRIRNPSLWEENKVSSRAEDDAKSAEVGTCKAGHQSNLSRV